MGFDSIGDVGVGFIFNLVPIFFLVIFGIMIFSISKGIIQWSKNNKQPQIPIEAMVVSKRTNVSYHNHGENMSMSSRSTTYYVTFQFINMERIEVVVNGREYGLLVEGDKGILTIQGTRYIKFDRN